MRDCETLGQPPGGTSTKKSRDRFQRFLFTRLGCHLFCELLVFLEPNFWGPFEDTPTSGKVCSINCCYFSDLGVPSEGKTVVLASETPRSALSFWVQSKAKKETRLHHEFG